MNQRLVLMDLDLPTDAALAIFTLNGARIPSIAEELATDLRTMRSRVAESRRYRLVVASFAPMPDYRRANT